MVYGALNNILIFFPFFIFNYIMLYIDYTVACLPLLSLCMHVPHHTTKTQCLCASVVCVGASWHI